MIRNVTVDKVGGNPRPERAVDYKENVHEFLGGLLSVSVRYIHKDRYIFFGIRLPRKANTENVNP